MMLSTSRNRFVFAVLIVSAACASDNGGSSTEPNPGTTSNGTTIAVDSVVDNQVAVVGSTLTITVRVKSATGAPVAGDTVKWNVATGGGSVSSTTSLTDVNGIATVSWTIGKTVGPNSLGANITGAAVPINATGIVGPLALFTKLSPDSQTVTARGSVLLTVRTADQYGNVVSKVPVHWTTTGGALVPDSTATGTSGNGQAVSTTPSGASRYVVTAAAAGFPPLTFIVKTL